MKGALEGVRVVEFSSFTAGPLCGELLAQLGADVVKIEPPGGDHLRRLAVQFGGMSYLYHINNAGKRSVVADLKQGEGRKLASDLAADADVVLENFAPGTLERYGLGYADLRRENPGLVYCSVNGFGRSGPLRNERAYDVVTQGLAGIISLTGYEAQPVKVGPSIVDMMGAVVGASSIIAALLHRSRTGEGQAVELAMYDVATWLTAEAWPALLSAGLPGPIGSRSRSIAWQGVFATCDAYVVLAVTCAAQRAALSSMVNATGDVASDEPLTEAVRAWCGARLAAEVVGLARLAGIVAAPILTAADVATHPQFVERGIIVERTDCQGRRGTTLGSAFRMTQTPGVAHGFAEPVGASTDQILAELKLRRATPGPAPDGTFTRG